MPSSTTLLLCLALTSTTGWARYTLQQDFMQGGNFLDQFTFWDTADPTHGFVQYVTQSEAEMSGMINQTANQITLATDDKETTTVGRKSIRITSNLSFSSGLVILDLAHMPGSICGSWPAFWTVGPNWPNQGEIDIIEGVNTNTMNAMTLHTGEGCTINQSGSSKSDVFTGTVSTSNCDVNAANQPTNAGCSIEATSSNTYGTGFNNAGGGVYAMELTSTGIAVYHFARGQIPSDITSGSPNPSTWGTPLAAFQGDCDFPSKFTNQQIVFDNTFCGDWAGAVWPGSSCAAQYGSSCENFVGQNPSAFAESYWTINSLKLYQDNGAGNGWGAGSSGAPTQTGWPGHSTFVTATSAASGRPSGFSHPPGGPHHGHGGPPGSGAPPGFTSPVNSSPSQASPSAHASSPVQASSSPAQATSSPTTTTPPNSAQPSQTPPNQGAGALSSPASPSHTWAWGQGSNNNNNNGGGYSIPNYSGAQGNVEAQTASVSQNAPGSVAPASTSAMPTSGSCPAPSGPVLAAEHSQSAGVYAVVDPVHNKRESHLRMHQHHHVHGRRGGRF